MTLAYLLIIVVVFIALLAFVPFFRSMVSGLLRFAFLIVVIFLALAATAVLMNNETVFDRPGWKARSVRFVTENSANTSEKGLGDAPCAIDQHAEAKSEDKAEEARVKLKKKKEAAAPVAAATPTATPTPAPEAEEENLYDELMTRNYICEGDTPIAIGRPKLLEMVQQTIAELKGWKLVAIDPHSGVLNCLYTSRVFGLEDDVRIAITPKSDVEICSQSKAGEPGSTSLVAFFHGDFGGNMGHIKQFYAALKDKTDQYCQELIEKQKPKSPNH
jgi:hypothetical protein